MWFWCRKLMLMISHLCRFVYYGNKWPILWKQTAFSGVSAWRNLSQTTLWDSNQCVYWTLNIVYRTGNNGVCIKKIRFCRQGIWSFWRLTYLHIGEPWHNNILNIDKVCLDKCTCTLTTIMYTFILSRFNKWVI